MKFTVKCSQVAILLVLFSLGAMPSAAAQTVGLFEKTASADPGFTLFSTLAFVFLRRAVVGS